MAETNLTEYSQKPAKASDRELLRMYRGGFVPAFDELHNRYRPLVFRYLRNVGRRVICPEEADDLTSECSS